MPFQILNICKNDYVRQNIKSFKQQIIQNIFQNEKPPPPTRRWETGGAVQTRCSQIGVMAYITSIAIILYCFLRWQMSLQMPAVSNAALQTWPLPAAECEAPEPILRRAIVCSAIKNTFWISTKEQAVQTHAQLVPGPVSLSGLQSSNQYFNENDASSDGFRYHSKVNWAYKIEGFFVKSDMGVLAMLDLRCWVLGFERLFAPTTAQEVWWKAAAL